MKTSGTNWDEIPIEKHEQTFKKIQRQKAAVKQWHRRKNAQRRASKLAEDEKQALYLRDNHPYAWFGFRYYRTHRNAMLNLTSHRYLRSIYLDDSDYMVLKKSTQCGITEYLVVRTMMEAMGGRDIFYVLPTIELMGRFVKNRVNTSLSYTPYIGDRVRDIPNHANNVGLKHIGQGAVAFVGSNAPSAFTEYPADTVIIDELDRCNQENLEMAWERLSHSEEKRQVKVSNPTIEDFAIDREYNLTDQKIWAIHCDSCGHYNKVDFFRHVVRQVAEDTWVVRDPEWIAGSDQDIRLICDKCESPLDRFGRGQWIARVPGIQKSGYHISKLFSSTVFLTEIVERFDTQSESALQRFYNADLGLAYTAQGAKVNRSDLLSCRREFDLSSDNPIRVAGVDVGSVFNVRINQIAPDGSLQFVLATTCENPEDVIGLAHRYGVTYGVIDAMPESRISRSISAKLGWFICFYGNVKRDVVDPRMRQLTVQRTEVMDEVREVIKTGRLHLPMDIDDNGLYMDQMQSPTRIFDEKRMEYVWTETSPDHYFHAEVYALLATKLARLVKR